MNQYEFTLTFRLHDAEESPEKFVEELGAHGCEDALVGIGKLGSIALTFNRESQNARKAIATAIRDVKHVIPGATLVEATPDFVGMTDVARIYGTTRQYIRKVVTSRSTSFPDPVHEGNPSLWHLADVLDWVGVHKPERFDQRLLEVARINMQINSYKVLVKASAPSGLSVDFTVKGSPRDAEWASVICESLGNQSGKTPRSSLGRTRKKTRAA